MRLRDGSDLGQASAASVVVGRKRRLMRFAGRLAVGLGLALARLLAGLPAPAAAAIWTDSCC